MISMDFLTQRVAGTEFIDFQNNNFRSEMVRVIKEHTRDAGGRTRLEESVADDLKKVIEQYTGFNNITFKFQEEGNLYVDTGFFSPGHVLNNAGVDAMMKATQTTLYRWYTENKSKVFKGGVSYTTGKVFGSFCGVPIELGINVFVDDYFPRDRVKKWDTTVEDMLAAGICHELGHAWSGCMMLMTVLEDNLVAQAGLNAYRGATRTEDRVVVLKDAATLLGMKPAKADELLEFAKSDSEESFLMYYTKLTVQRDNQRALSVGVTNMTSEVVADMYSIRMGFDKGMVAAIGVMVDRGIIVEIADNFMFSAAMAVFAGYSTLVIGYMTVGALTLVPIAMATAFATASILMYFAKGYSGIYNADHRRMDDAIRQLIAKLKETKRMPAADKAKLVTDLTSLLDMNKKLRPWYEGTFIGRAIGWIFSGSDFKLKEIEHYTQALNNNELSVLSEQLKGV